MRSFPSTARRVVVKIGTSALTHATGRFDRAHFDRLASELLAAARTCELVVVSSGAIALGVERLGLAARPRDIPGKQACAAVGQSRLVRAYEEAFATEGRSVAQVLLTHGDVQDRRRYLNIRHTLERLLAHGVVPIINENDTVSVDELKFSDNDTLAGLVAALVGADALVLLSDVEALFDADPKSDPSAKPIRTVEAVTEALLSRAGGSGGGLGTGGMATKLSAVAKATEIGVGCVIASGQEPGRLTAVLAGEEVGTWFPPRKNRRTAKAGWIAHALVPRGKLWVDEGAASAVRDQDKSLLPSGIARVEGAFERGDPVELVDPSGRPFARGLAAYDADELRRIAGRKSAEIEALLGYRDLDEAVHRDDLALLALPAGQEAKPGA